MPLRAEGIMMRLSSFFQLVCVAVFGFATLACDDGSCDTGDRVYENGQAWLCSDGCNSCKCNDGVVTSTLAGCLAQPGPAAGKLFCHEGGESHRHGETWVCTTGCNCSCDDGTTVLDPDGC